MHWILVLYTVLLFVLLTPAIFVRLPPNGNKWTVAFVHGLIFALVYHFTQHFFLKLSYGFEGFKEGANNPFNLNKKQLVNPNQFKNPTLPGQKNQRPPM